jgi:hypothetical protein
MKVLKSLTVLCCLVAVAGCAAIFGRSTDDPAIKLKWASELFSSKDDPVRAEELIRDALEIYRKDRNQLGMAEAYRQYGLFLRSNAVSRFAEYYKEEADKTVTFKTRYEKAIDYQQVQGPVRDSPWHIDIPRTCISAWPRPTTC